VEFGDINYEKMFDASPAIMLCVNLMGRVTRANNVACLDLNRKKSEVEGKFISELFPIDAPMFLDGYKRVIETGEPILGVIEKCHSPSGEERWSLCNKMPCFNKAGQIVGVNIMALNITGQKNLEKDLTKANQILELQSVVVENIFNSEGSIEEILMEIGTKLNLDSIFIYRCNGDACLFNSWSSNANMVFPAKLHMNGCENDIRSWIERGKPSCGSASDLPTELELTFKASIHNKLNTIAFIPVIHQDTAWGIVGFGARNSRQWREKEVGALSGLGKLLAMLAKTSSDNMIFLDAVVNEFSEIDALLGNSASMAGDYGK